MLLLLAFALTLGTGVWHGELEGKPAVVLDLQQHGNHYTGTIAFTFFLKKGDRWEPSGETKLPLLGPKFDGKVLTFEVAHRDPRDNNRPVPMRFELTAPDQAILRNLRHPDMPPVTMRKAPPR
jgi:hypothetical protein